MKNQMKAPLFARGVFREGLRRLRLTTVIITVLLTLSALVTPIVSVIEKTSDPYFKMSELTAVTVDAFEHHAAFLALFALAAPLVAPENRPSVMSETVPLSRGLQTMASVVISISGMPLPRGPS